MCPISFVKDVLVGKQNISYFFLSTGQFLLYPMQEVMGRIFFFLSLLAMTVTVLV